MAAASAIIGAVGTIGSIAQNAMPTRVSSISTLDPVQQALQMQQIGELNKYRSGNINMLNSMGQNAPNAYDSLGAFNREYNNKIGWGNLGRVKTGIAALRDRVHSDESANLVNRFRKENSLNMNSLKQNLLMQDADIKQAATENMWGRQYKALGGLAGLFGAVNGQNRENWVRNNPTGMEMGVAGMTGVSSLARGIGTLADEARMAGGGSSGWEGSGMDWGGSGGGTDWFGE